jgi:subtilisin family serine protease
MKYFYKKTNNKSYFFFLQFLLFFFLLSSFVFAGDKGFYSYSPDGKIEYSISKKKILVKFNEGLSFAEQSTIVNEFPLLKTLNRDMLLPSPKVAVLEFIDDAISEEKISKILVQLNQNSSVLYANPFLVFKDGTLQGITDQFAVKLKNESDLPLLLDEAKKSSVKISKQYSYDNLLYFITVDKSSAGNALDLANKFAESNKFAFSEPDFLLFLKKFNTNDTFLNYQWSLNNTGSALQFNGTAGADMKIFNAWGITTGSSSIKVAIIDEGVDLVHPDLLANMLGGYDGTGLGSGGAPSGDDAHGTACAGIVAGVGNNNLGVAGVAYNCKIVPIRIAYSSGASWITQNSWIGASIDWAWNQGAADVLSNSWGGGGSSSLINDPIGRALSQGRGGLGSPVLFAAGNDNSVVSYPATLQNVIAVAAMSMCNQRKNPASCDGENFWGSNFGTNVDIAAPGVKIYTTDISGASGYSTGNYTATFNGTSSATPNAAGVMALILSSNPTLTAAQARQIIESTCDKVGGYTYNSGVTNQPNGTWSTDLGYGRVNAFTALQLANPTACTNPPPVATTIASPNSICVTSNVLLTLSGITLGTGQTYQWQSSPNNTSYTNVGGALSFSLSASVNSTRWYRCAVTCGGTTTNSTPVQVVFNDPTISAFPYTQNFDASSALPCGWSVSNVNTDGSTWAVGTTNSRSAPNTMTYSYSATNAANDWFFTPPLTLVGGQSYRVRFWYRARSGSFPERLEVKWGNAATAAGMTSSAVFSNANITSTTYAEGTSSLISPSSSGTYYVGFRAYSLADMYDLYVDDVTIETITSCGTPLVGGTISGPAALTAGAAGTYNLVSNTGTSVQWQQSLDGGTNWTDISSATSSSLSYTGNIGTVQLRAKSSSSSCPDVFSNILSITVNSRVGDSQSNPIIASLPYTSTLSNSNGSGFTSTYTGTNQQTSADIFYRFTTGPCTDSIRISTCSSNFDTYIHLLTSTGTFVESNDDNGPYCAGTRASLKRLVTPNTTYFVVAEGYGTATGNVSMEISEIDNPSLTVSISAGGPTTFYQGGSVTLSSNRTGTHLWTPGGQTGVSISATQSGNYSVVHTNANGCSASSNTISVTVNPLLIPTISISQDASNLCNGIVFSSSITNGGTLPSYQWKKNTVDISGANSSTYATTDVLNGDIITCVLVSNNPIADPNPVSSNSITVSLSFSSTNWTGTISSNSALAGNWSNGLPSRNKNVVINSSAFNICIVSQNLECNNLTVQAGASVVINSAINIDVYGNIINDGTFTFNLGALRFFDCSGLGSILHTIDSNNSSLINFYDLEQNVSVGTTLNCNANLKNTLTLAKGTFTNNGQIFTLQSTATKTARIAPVASQANYAGNITMERFAPGGLTGWAFLGNPVQNSTLSNWMDDFATSGFTGATGNAGSFVSVFTYNEAVNGTSGNGYVPPTNANNVVVQGKGYMVYLGTGSVNTNNITIDVTGPISKGAFTFPITYNNTTPIASPDNDGWNLIANPYPSAIDWDSPDWSRNGVNGAIYIYNADIQQYATYVAGSGGLGVNGGTNIIASSQGFWIKANSINPTLIATTEQVKSAGNATFFRSSSTSSSNGIIKLKLSQGSNFDETMIRTNELATENFDNDFDAGKLYSINPNLPNVSSKLNGLAYAINTVYNFNETSEIPVELKLSQVGEVQLLIEGTQNYSNETFLKDNLSQSLIPINSDTTITIVVTDTSLIRSQYSLLFNPDLTVSNNTVKTLKIGYFPNPTDGNLFISANASSIKEINVFNALGQLIASNTNSNVIDVSNISAGIYYFNVKGRDGSLLINDKFIKK